MNCIRNVQLLSIAFLSTALTGQPQTATARSIDSNAAVQGVRLAAWPLRDVVRHSISPFAQPWLEAHRDWEKPQPKNPAPKPPPAPIVELPPLPQDPPPQPICGEGETCLYKPTGGSKVGPAVR